MMGFARTRTVGPGEGGKFENDHYFDVIATSKQSPECVTVALSSGDPNKSMNRSKVWD